MLSRTKSYDRPPPSRGTHKRLTSISNDDWEEQKVDQANRSNSGLSSSEDEERGFRSGHAIDDDEEPPNERSSLLPPTGISTNERDGKHQPSYSSEDNRRSRRKQEYSGGSRQRQLASDEQGSTMRFGDQGLLEEHGLGKVGWYPFWVRLLFYLSGNLRPTHCFC